MHVWETVAGQIILGGGALGAIARWIALPLWRAGRRISKGVAYLEGEMRNNGGSTMRDAIDKLREIVDRIEDKLDDHLNEHRQEGTR